MKHLKQLFLILGIAALISGTSFAQRGPEKGRHKPVPHHGEFWQFGLSDSCWKVFLGELPADTAKMLTDTIENVKDIRVRIDSLLKELRDEREDGDTAAVDSLKDKIKYLAEKRLDDIKVISEIIRKYHDVLADVRKTCDSDHKGGNIGLKVTPIVPNPATTKAHFSYTINAEENVDITISDQLGNIVKHVFDGQADAGEHDIELDLNGLKPGMYLVRIQAGPDINTIKLMIVQTN
jgi:hypothetical protein